MKNLTVTAVIICLLSCWSCKKLVSFNLNYNNTVSIPANSLINLPLEILTPSTETNSEQEFESNGTASSLISKIELTQLDLRILSPENANFNFLSGVEVFLSAPDLDEIRIAYKTDIPNENAQTLDLICEDHDLKEYIKKSSYSLRVKAITDESLTQNVDVNVHSKLQVDAGIF